MESSRRLLSLWKFGREASRPDLTIGPSAALGSVRRSFGCIGESAVDHLGEIVFMGKRVFLQDQCLFLEDDSLGSRGGKNE